MLQEMVHSQHLIVMMYHSLAWCRAAHDLLEKALSRRAILSEIDLEFRSSAANGTFSINSFFAVVLPRRRGTICEAKRIEVV